MLTLMIWLAAGADEYYQELSKERARLNETIRYSVKIIADFHQSGFFNERTMHMLDILVTRLISFREQQPFPSKNGDA